MLCLEATGKKLIKKTYLNPGFTILKKKIKKSKQIYKLL